MGSKKGCGKRFERYDLILKCGDWIPNENESPLFREQLFCEECEKEFALK